MTVAYILGRGLDLGQCRVVHVFVVSVERRRRGIRPTLGQQAPLELVVMEIASLMTRDAHQQHVVRLVLLQQRREMPDQQRTNTNTNKNLYSAKFVDKTRQRRWVVS